MLTAIDTTQVACGWDGDDEERTITQEMLETRREVTVEDAVNLPETTRLYWGGERIYRPGHYPGAKWSIGNRDAGTLVELVACLSLSTSVLR